MVDKIKIGIIRGGANERYASSLVKGGEAILHIHNNLSDKYKVIDILIDKNNRWHINGIPILPIDLMRKIDVAWNLSQDADVSMILNNLSIPNIENDSFLRGLENNNDMLQIHLKNIGVKMPRFIISPKNAREVFEKFSSPWVVKINNEIKLVKTFNELIETIKDENNIIVEEFIEGTVSSVYSLTGFRGEDVYVLPPQNFSISEKEKIINLVKNLHKHLGVKHYLKSDFILHPRRGFFLTSINLSPDLRKESHFEQSCKAIGAETHHVIEHILKRALDRKTYRGIV